MHKRMIEHASSSLPDLRLGEQNFTTGNPGSSTEVFSKNLYRRGDGGRDDNYADSEQASIATRTRNPEKMQPGEGKNRQEQQEALNHEEAGEHFLMQLDPRISGAEQETAGLQNLEASREAIRQIKTEQTDLKREARNLHEESGLPPTDNWHSREYAATVQKEISNTRMELDQLQSQNNLKRKILKRNKGLDQKRERATEKLRNLENLATTVEDLQATTEKLDQLRSLKSLVVKDIQRVRATQRALVDFQEKSKSSDQSFETWKNHQETHLDMLEVASKKRELGKAIVEDLNTFRSEVTSTYQANRAAPEVKNLHYDKDASINEQKKIGPAVMRQGEDSERGEEEPANPYAARIEDARRSSFNAETTRTLETNSDKIVRYHQNLQDHITRNQPLPDGFHEKFARSSEALYESRLNLLNTAATTQMRQEQSRRTKQESTFHEQYLQSIDRHRKSSKSTANVIQSMLPSGGVKEATGVVVQAGENFRKYLQNRQTKPQEGTIPE